MRASPRARFDPSSTNSAAPWRSRASSPVTFFTPTSCTLTRPQRAGSSLGGAGSQASARDSAYKVSPLTGRCFDLDAGELELLCEACIGHSDGLLEADVTVQTCWDADRLDLGRVGIEPDPSRLCTPAAREPEIIAWAFARSVRD